MGPRFVRSISSAAVFSVLAFAAPAWAAPEDDPASGSSTPSDSGSAAPTTTEAPKPYCEQQAPAGENLPDPPWTQAMLAIPERVTPYSTGAGVTVAVISTGVEVSHPQLDGKVLEGFDFVLGKSGANQDCVGQGTALAGIIAAARTEGVGFFGLAPDVAILPVRISQAEVGADIDSTKLSPDTLAAAINWSVQQGAEVILSGVTFYGAGSEALEAAVAAAIKAGVVVVAGAGDKQPNEGAKEFEPVGDDLRPYPASYPDVVGVGAIDASRQRVPQSEIGDFVDVVAPGSELISTGTSGQRTIGGTMPAAAFVAATVALVLGAKPPVVTAGQGGLTKPAAAVKRVLATASPTAGDGLSGGYGVGLLDPYRALTETLSEQNPEQPTPHAGPTPNAAAKAAAADRSWTSSLSRTLTWSALGLLSAIAIGAALWARGRRRAWASGAVSQRALIQEEPEPEFMSGEKLFAPKELD